MSSIKLKHSGGNSVSLNPPTAAPNPPNGTELALKLPSTYGSSGQFMKTDGAGALSFDTVPVPTLNSLSGTISQSQLATGVGGKVIQCTYKQWNNAISTTATTLEEIDSTLRMTFTPILNNSLIVYDATLFIANATSGRVLTLELQKSDYTDMSSPSVVYEHRTDSTLTNSHGNLHEYTAGGLMAPSNLRVLEVSGSTTARTYSPFWETTGGTLWNNQYTAANYVGTSSIVIQEIVV